MSWNMPEEPFADRDPASPIETVILPRTRDLGDGFEVRRALPSMRRRMVPSRAAIPREETNSEATGNRFHTACKRVASWRAVNRLVSFSPLPFLST